MAKNALKKFTLVYKSLFLSNTLLIICLLLLLVLGCTEKHTRQQAVELKITKAQIQNDNLTIAYEIKNDLSDDIWICVKKDDLNKYVTYYDEPNGRLTIQLARVQVPEGIFAEPISSTYARVNSQSVYANAFSLQVPVKVADYFSTQRRDVFIKLLAENKEAATNADIRKQIEEKVEAFKKEAVSNALQLTIGYFDTDISLIKGAKLADDGSYRLPFYMFKELQNEDEKMVRTKIDLQVPCVYYSQM